MSVTHNRHGLRLKLYRSPHGGLTADPEQASLFQRAADWTSAAMGRPANIVIWLVAVIVWTLTFAIGGSHISSGRWLPAWFTSQGFNFPLNLVTTVAELFIGFLVGAASNRSERNLEATLGRIEQLERSVDEQAKTSLTLLRSNTDLITQDASAADGRQHDAQPPGRHERRTERHPRGGRTRSPPAREGHRHGQHRTGSLISGWFRRLLWGHP
jgi:low affinity Fe/Cu permease